MKRYLSPTGSMPGTVSWSGRWAVTDERAALLRILVLPLLSALVAFLLAVALTGFGVPAVGTARSTVAGFAYVHLTLCILALPAYCAGLLWFWWITRADDARLLTRLCQLPLIAALFAWFPSTLMSSAPLREQLSALPMLAVSTLLLGYLWIGLVRLIYFLWRRQ
jgi:hypothetical protein